MQAENEELKTELAALKESDLVRHILQAMIEKLEARLDNLESKNYRRVSTPYSDR